MTSLYDFDDRSLLDICWKYCDSHPNFSTHFISTLNDWLDDHDELTEGQREALIYTIEKHHMEH